MAETETTGEAPTNGLVFNANTTVEDLTVVVLILAALFLAAMSAMMIWALFSEKNRDKLVQFLLEKTGGEGKPSISRLQMFIWNSVIAFSFLYVLARSTGGGGAPDTKVLKEAIDAIFSWPVLVLLGISNGTYYLGKRAQQGGGQAPVDPSVDTAVGGIPEANDGDTAAAPQPQAPMG